MRGQRIVRITGELLTDMMRQGWRVPNVHGEVVMCHKGLPPDTQLIGCWWDAVFNVAVLKFESASWDEVPEGSEVPAVQVSHSWLRMEPTEGVA